VTTCNGTKSIFNEELRKALTPIRGEVKVEANNGWLVLEVPEKGNHCASNEEGQQFGICSEFEDRLHVVKEKVESYCKEIDSLYGHSREILDSIRPRMREAAQNVKDEVQADIDSIIASIPERMELVANEITRSAHDDLKRLMRRVERRGRKACKDYNRTVDLLEERNLIDATELRPRRKGVTR